MCIAVICVPVCQVINVEINHSFPIKLLFYITETSGQKCNYLKKKKSFQHKINSIYHHFKRTCIERNKHKFFLESDNSDLEKYCFIG